MNRLKKATKCSALLILPGTASFNKSSGKIGLAMNVSSSLAELASLNPSTNFVYSFFNRCASVFFILITTQKISKLGTPGMFF